MKIVKVNSFWIESLKIIYKVTSTLVTVLERIWLFGKSGSNSRCPIREYPTNVVLHVKIKPKEVLYKYYNRYYNYISKEGCHDGLFDYY